MKKQKRIKGRFIALCLSSAILTTAMPFTAVYSANVEETTGTQLQTILIDNDGKNLWNTESWGGANILPNTSWTTSDMYDYFYNGFLEFEVKSNGEANLPFYVGITSHSHNKSVTLYWTDLEKYNGKIVAPADWTTYKFPLNELIENFPDEDFDRSNVWKIAVGALKSGNTASFRNVKIYSEDEERQHPFVKVNQVGYTCNGKKNAKVSCFAKFGSLNEKTFEIVNAETNEVVYTDTLSNPVLNETASGESVYDINFDAVTKTGIYYIRIPNADLNKSALTPRDREEGLQTDTIVSYSFKISDSVYDDLMTDMTKYYYYQRQGINLDEKYAGEFAREDLHPGDYHVVKWSDRNNPDAETFDISQGWYDAGDYGKYTSAAATSVENLLLAYDLYPQVFENVNPNIPETDKSNSLYVNAPAILSEVKWEIDMLLKLEHQSKDGSFYAAANYKDGVIYIEDTLYSTSDYTKGAKETDLRSHLATSDMAAMLAHAYIVYKDIPEYSEFAEQCLETAERSWKWINDSANEMHMSIGAANRTYTFTQEELDRSMYWAAGSLYRAMKTAGKSADEYEKYLIDNCDTEHNTWCFSSSSLGYSHKGRSFLGYFYYLYQNDSPSEKIKNVFSKYETWRNRILKYECFGTDYPEWGYWWGSNQVLAQSTMTLLLGSMIYDDKISDVVLDSNQKAFNYFLGVNPISFSYVSGYGENSVKNIFSAIYSKDVPLEPYKCPSGYVTEGANSNNNPHLSKYIGKCYMDSDAEYTTNENTIYGNAAMILLTASMIARTERSSVKGDVNADGEFNIADAILLQKWLINPNEIKLPNWKNADLCEDNMLDVVDLCIMKNSFLGK